MFDPAKSFDRHFWDYDEVKGADLLKIKDCLALLPVRDSSMFRPLPAGSPEHPHLVLNTSDLRCEARKVLTDPADMARRH